MFQYRFFVVNMSIYSVHKSYSILICFAQLSLLRHKSEYSNGPLYRGKYTDNVHAVHGSAKGNHLSFPGDHFIYYYYKQRPPNATFYSVEIRTEITILASSYVYKYPTRQWVIYWPGFLYKSFAYTHTVFMALTLPPRSSSPVSTTIHIVYYITVVHVKQTPMKVQNHFQIFNIQYDDKNTIYNIISVKP